MTVFEWSTWCPCCEAGFTTVLTREQAEKTVAHLQAQLLGLDEYVFGDEFTPKTAPAGAEN